MRNLGLYGFITMVIVAAACVMLAAESHPAMIVLLLGGLGLLAFRVNAIIDRGRTRRGTAPDFTTQFADLAALTARDWTELVITVIVSVAMCAIGIVVFGARHDESPGKAIGWAEQREAQQICQDHRLG